VTALRFEVFLKIRVCFSQEFTQIGQNPAILTLPRTHSSKSLFLFLPIRSGGGVQVVTEESRRVAILFVAYQVGTPAEATELVHFSSRAAFEDVGIEESAISGERAPMTPRRKRKRVHDIDSTNKSGFDKGAADKMASGVVAIASEIASSRQVRGGKAAQEAANADELLSLLQKATESYSSTINPAMKERWRKQIGILEE
jgi:hypothetical protein